MTIWDLRQYVETHMPWWTLIVFSIIIVIIAFIVRVIKGMSNEKGK